MVIGFLRSLGICTFYYLGDWLIVVESVEILCSYLATTVRITQSLDFVIDVERSNSCSAKGSNLLESGFGHSDLSYETGGT